MVKLFLPKLLSVGCWNIQGLYDKVNGIKTCKLGEETFQNILKKFDILCLQESHVSKEHVNKTFKDYVAIPHCRNMSKNNRYFGGMLLYIKKTIRKGIKIKQDFDQDVLEVVLSKTFFSLKEDKHILFTYASPINSCYTKARSINILEKIETKKADYQNTLIIGDLNGRTKNGDDFVRDSSDKHSPINISPYNKDTEITRRNEDNHVFDQQGKLILDLCKSSNLRILNGRQLGDMKGQFTRFPLNKPNENPSVIDYALCGSALLNEIFSFSVLPFTELSDHCCISVTIKINRAHVYRDENESTTKINPNKEFYNFDKNRINIFKENIMTDNNLALLNTFLHKTDPNEQEILGSISCLNDILVNAAKKSFLPPKKGNKAKSRKNKKHNNKSWFNTECANYRKILRKYSRNLSSNPFDPNTLNLFQKYRAKYKSACRKAEKQHRRHLTEQLLHVELNDPKRFWEIINKMNNWGIEKTDQTEYIEPSTWHKHFKSLLNRRNSRKESTQTHVTKDRDKIGNLWNYETFDPIIDGRITAAEMRDALRQLKNRKSPGPDRIIAEYLKVFGENYECILLKIIRTLFARHLYPPQWDTNYLKPIHKKDDIEDPDNYRGIALGSPFAKLFSLILHNRLKNYIETKQLISPNQIGFMKGSRTSDHIFLLQTIIEKIVKKNKDKLYTAFIDFKKAYDTIDRDTLFQRLKTLGINGLFFQNIVAMYENTKYLIKVKNGYLDPITSNLGLRQGCPLSPMLFNLYIEDIKDIFEESCNPITIQDEKISHFLYADDLVLISNSAEGLQNSLDKLSHYASLKYLTINTKKSKTMIFNPTGKYIKGEFNINKKIIEPVKSFCYLGFEVKPSGTVKHAMNNLHDKANKALRPLLCAIARFNIPTKISIKLFHSLITPIILYNVENWATMTDKGLMTFTETDLFDNSNNYKADIIHRKALKYILGLSKSCPNMAVHGDTGEVPLSIKGYKLMLDFWNRLNTLPESNLAKKALKENVCIRTNWIQTIEKLLRTFNLTGITNNTQTFKLASEINTKKYYKSVWETKIKSEALTRLKFYQVIKNEFTPAKYIDIPNFTMRKIIAKVRCSNHCLEIEKGRHRNIPREERWCNMCTDKVTEDEIHFLTKCKSYDHLKIKHQITTSNASDIINTANQENLAKYLISAFNLRQETLTDVNKKQPALT